MRLNPFKAIRFCQRYWDSGILESLHNPYGPNRVSNTEQIMEFVRLQISRGIATMDPTPSIYIMQSNVGALEITLIAGEVIHDDRFIFYQTEETHCEKLGAYNNIFSKYKMQINPILTFHNNGKLIEPIVQNFVVRSPDTEAIVDGTKHKLWRISDPLEIQYIKKATSPISKLYIADGNHRFLMFNERSSKLNSCIMVAITDPDSIVLKSFHRVIMGTLPNNWIERMSQRFTVRLASKSVGRMFGESPNDAFTSYGANGEILFVLDTLDVYGIIPKHRDPTTPIYDVVMADIIRDTLGIQGDRVFSIPGNLDITDVNKIFDLYKGGAAIVFVPNVKMANFLKIVSDGKKLPPTSTWFEPKTVDGLLIRSF
jgi:uncharacterized protein (DUF1015 family)